MGAAAALVLAGCNGPPDSGAEAERTIVYGRGEESLKLDPADVIDGESIKVIVNLFDTLVAYQPQGIELVPGLARRWDVDDDGRTWTFHLRPNVRFHDRTPCNAEAVKVSLERLIDEKHPYHWQGTYPYRASYTMIESIEVLGPHRVRFRLREPSAVFLANMAMFPASIVSPPTP